MSMSHVAIPMLLAGLLMTVTAQAASLDDEVKSAYTAWDAAFNKSDARVR
jgi:hypothetical protein